MLSATAPLDLPTLMILAGVVIVIIMLRISAKRRMSRPQDEVHERLREHLARTYDHDGLRNDISELVMQLQRLSREINSQIDVRFAKLEKAITDADRRIAELKALSDHREPLESSPEKAEPVPHDVDGEASHGVVSLPRETAAPAPPSPIASSAADRPVAPALTQQVLQLAKSGQSAIDIARQLGHSVGEIELIIKLNRHSAS